MEMHKAEMKQSVKSRKRKVREGLVIFLVALSQFFSLLIETLSTSLVQQVLSYFFSKWL